MTAATEVASAVDRFIESVGFKPAAIRLGRSGFHAFMAGLVHAEVLEPGSEEERPFPTHWAGIRLIDARQDPDLDGWELVGGAS